MLEWELKVNICVDRDYNIHYEEEEVRKGHQKSRTTQNNLKALSCKASLLQLPKV